MAHFNIAFRWYNTGTYCSNLVVADNESQVREHYKEMEIIGISKASDYDLEDAIRRGKPIIDATKKIG